MKKILLSLTIVAATFISNVSHAERNFDDRFNNFAQVNAVRTLKSIKSCKVVDRTPVETLVSANCVDEKISTAIAHLKTDSYVEQISERIEATFNYYLYANSYVFYAEEDNVGLSEDVYTLSYSTLGKLGRKYYGYSTLALEDAVEAAIHEIEMFR